MGCGRPVRAVVVLAAAALLPSCSAVGGRTPPDCGWFDVTARPAGALPAAGGYWLGAAAWSPAEFLLGGVLPAPLDGAVGRTPGEVLGTALGLAAGAPFHLLALPLDGGGEEEPGPASR